MEMSIKLLDVLKDPTELGLEDHCHTDMWAIVELRKTIATQTCGPSLNSGTLLQENTSTGDPRGVAKAHKPS